MSAQRREYDEEQDDLFVKNNERALLDQLLSESRLYYDSHDYLDLLEFVARFRGFSPFNAMLLQIQRPGLTYAASARDWEEKFGRHPASGARPLIILRPFGPISLVYDVIDTEGDELPANFSTFEASGEITVHDISAMLAKADKPPLKFKMTDYGDGFAGQVERVHWARHDKDQHKYEILVNRNHKPAVQFCTIVHELAHLFLGHLGPDANLKVKERRYVDHQGAELEAESVAYIVCHRVGVTSRSERYLADYVDSHSTAEDIDLYQVMTAALKVIDALRITADTCFETAPAN